MRTSKPSSPPAQLFATFRLAFLLLLLSLLAVFQPLSAATPGPVWAQNNIITGYYNAGEDAFIWAMDANNLIGTGALYGQGYWGLSSMIANVEGGLAWGGHEVFQSRESVPITIGSGITIILSLDTFDHNASVPQSPEAPGAGQYDGHATAVTAMMAGLSFTEEGYLSALGTGIAPLARIQSGAIASEWDSENSGSFSVTWASFSKPYLDFFTGGDAGPSAKADVINSSWGYTDPSGRGTEDGISFTGYLDAWAHDNPTVALVVAAGNAGNSSAPGGPASGFNSISVGALDATRQANGNYVFDHAADFSSGGRLDFYNPETGETLTGVRCGVDIAAPGTGMVLATYMPPAPGDDPANGWYIINGAGTSFAAPMVSGGIALLKDVAKAQLSGNTLDNALDTRAIKAIIMAGATRTVGWNNGQQLVMTGAAGDSAQGVLLITRPLDDLVGAGLLNLERSAEILLNPVANGNRTGLDIAGGWDLVLDLAYGAEMTYTFSVTELAVELTLALSWFSNTVYNALSETYADLWFTNLDLELYRLLSDTGEGGTPDWERIAASESLYDSTELLHIALDIGEYAFRVVNKGSIYDTTNSGLAGHAETYAVAWSATPVPEPSAALYLLLAVGVALVWKRWSRRCVAV